MRREARNRMEEAVRMQIAAQGDSKAMNKYLASCKREAFPDEPEENDIGKFRALHGNGI